MSSVSVIHEERRQALDFRLLLFPILFLLGMIGLFLRLWYVQVVLGEDLKERALSSGSRAIQTPAPRGVIVDRKGKIVGGVVSKLAVIAQPLLALKNPSGLQRICELTGADPNEVKEKLEKEKWRRYLPVPIISNISPQAATRIAESQSGLSGFAVEAESDRIYSAPVEMCHLLGYVGTASKEDVTRLQKQKAWVPPSVGKTGIERLYDAALVGRPGAQEIETDAKKRPVRVVERELATPGSKLILSIDEQLQKLSVELLHGRKGAVVAIDPRNGEILCAASSPTYDASQFLGGISSEEYQTLLKNPDKPLMNRALSATYAPGSTFKIVTSLASYVSGQFNPSRSVYCGGAYNLGRFKIKCLGHHGSITYNTAFEKSCNVYFMQLARMAGRENMRKAAAMLGLGEKSGVDLSGEVKGIIPSDQFMKKHYRRDWYLGDTLQFGIGQGAVACTPLQMAQVAAVAGNRGKRFKPHVVRAVQAPGQSKPVMVKAELVQSIDASDVFWNALHRACFSVVQSGTARRAQVPGLEFGGKTGSAENRANHLTHSWFVCFAPLENPKIAMAVLVENAGHGGDVAAPIARELLTSFFRGAPNPIRQLQPAEPEVTIEPLPDSLKSDSQDATSDADGASPSDR